MGRGTAPSIHTPGALAQGRCVMGPETHGGGVGGRHQATSQVNNQPGLSSTSPGFGLVLQGKVFASSLSAGLPCQAAVPSGPWGWPGLPPLSRSVYTHLMLAVTCPHICIPSPVPISAWLPVALNPRFLQGPSLTPSLQ